MLHGPDSPICQPKALVDPKGMTLRQRVVLVSELRRKFARLLVSRRMGMLGTMSVGHYCLPSYDYYTLSLLAVAAEHNFVKPWFIPRLVVAVEWLPEPVA